jgi:hypothetical protein
MELVAHTSIVVALQDRNAQARQDVQRAARDLRDQIREQVQAQVQAGADDAAAAQARAQTGPTPPAPPNIVIHPPGTDRQIIVSGSQVPFNAGEQIPPQAVDMTIAFFLTVAVIVIGLPISRAFARRMDRKAAPSQIPREVTSQLNQLSQSVDAIALEVERISEGQRFTTRLLTEQRDAGRHSLPAGSER